MYEDKACSSKRNSIKAVGSNLQEHLGCFILVGYTIEGEPVQLTFAPTPQDMDSLSTGLHKFILHTGGL